MSCDILWCVGFVISAVVVYKIIDRILRLPRVGRYSDRYVLVTGCGQGIGYEAVKRLDQLGCNVFAGCRREESVLELKKTFSERVHPFQMDISDKESVRKALDYVSSRLPPNEGLWGLVNNAAILHMLPTHLFNLDLYEKTLAVNLIATVDVTLTFLPLIKKARGRIVNISSMAGRFTFEKLLPYCMSKYGLECFSDGMRRHLSSFGCKVLMVEPGFIETNMVEVGRHVKLCEDMQATVSEDTTTQRGNNATGISSSTEGDKLRKWLIRVRFFSPIEDAAYAYEHALFGLFPRARYVVGTDAKLAIFLQTFPEWFSDWAVQLAAIGL